jgi:hypothetical protein
MQGNQKPVTWCRAETAPLAICRAALLWAETRGGEA